MNRGLLIKSLREIWPVTLGFGLLLLLVETSIAFVLPQFQTNMLGVILKMDFARNMLGALLGTPVTGNIAGLMLQAIPWVHPLVLLIVFAHETTITTRQPAGEIDRGTIDILLSLPVSRWQVYACHSLVWAISGAVLLGMGLAGNWLGARLAHSAMAPFSRLGIAIFNAWCLYLAIGGFSCLIACLNDRRGKAVGIVIAVIISSFLINFLAGFWAPARYLNFLSVLNYYRPFFILESGRWPFQDITILLGAGLVLWLAGGIIFRHRDIHTL